MLDAAALSATAPAALPSRPVVHAAPGGDTEARARAAARDFTGFFLGKMLKTMRSTVWTSDIGHGGKGEEVFQELLDEEMGNELARGEGYGLSELIYESLMRKAERGLPAAATEGE